MKQKEANEFKAVVEKKESEASDQAKKAESDAALKTKIEEAQGALATFYSELKTKSEKRAAENLCALRPPHTPRWVSVCTRLAPHRP